MGHGVTERAKKTKHFFYFLSPKIKKYDDAIEDKNKY